ncbi:MAG TPA: NF038129 family PEP-CTERM protein [Terriglobia bacterium]|nr:NF038129 family PEP-CTERM protein [Terriglobia bacterium]
MNRIVYLLPLVLLWARAGLADQSYDVTVNTAPLNGMMGYLAFDFISGTPAGNAATISNFSSDGAPGMLTDSGSATGTVSPGPGEMTDSQFFNELLQGFTFGKQLSFELALSTNFVAGNVPDNFSFYLLDSGQNSFSTSDPTGSDALLSIDITGLDATPVVYTSSSATLAITPVSGMVSIPEPSSFAIVMVATALLLAREFRKGTAFRR